MAPCSYATADLSNVREKVIGRISRKNTPPSSTAAPSELWPSTDWRYKIIDRFQNRTVFTMGTPKTSVVYANAVPRLAMQHDHLLHAVVAITILHDRALTGSTQITSRESYHLGQAAARFNNKLSSHITDDDRDALWATAVYLCTTSVFTINTTDPEQVWPLGPANAEDLKWLHLQAGLRIIWSIADLYRRKGAFSHLGDTSDYNCVFPADPEPGIAGLPPLLVGLYELDQRSDRSNNPYHTAVRCLSWLLPMTCTPANMLAFMTFAGGMTKEYKSLLHEKDPRALLLMAIWYSRMFNSQWWMAPRALVECQAICRFLDRLRLQGPRFLKVLDLVKRACHLHLSLLSSKPSTAFTQRDFELVPPLPELG